MNDKSEVVEWYEIPVRVTRDGKTFIVPANEVRAGDIVLRGMFREVVHGILPDDEEEIMYIKINEIDAWPADIFCGNSNKIQ